jgi:hypothetical protein
LIPAAIALPAVFLDRDSTVNKLGWFADRKSLTIEIAGIADGIQEPNGDWARFLLVVRHAAT